MKSTLTPRAGREAGRRRKPRPRSLPKWLKSASGLQAIARSRCLLLLSVLSGETPVSDAIAQAKISRGTYYQLESRGLQGMLNALHPHTPGRRSTRADPATQRIAQLQAQVQRLAQEKRRCQRLLLLTRKSNRAPVTSGRRGRWPKLAPDSSLTGSNALPRSRAMTPNDLASPTTAPGERSR